MSSVFGVFRGHQFAQTLHLQANRFRLPIEIDQQMRIPRHDDGRAQIAPRRLQREMVRDLERRWQKALRKNLLHRRGRARHFVKRSRQRGARRRQRQQLHRDLGHDPEHSFRAHENPDQIEAGLVLVHPPAGAQHFAARQHHLEPDDVIARHAILHAARAARVRGHVPAHGCNSSDSPDPADRISFCSRARACNSPVITPGSTIATASAKLISLIRFMRASESAIPPRIGTQPPTYP